jgi:hypothetical protein
VSVTTAFATRNFARRFWRFVATRTVELELQMPQAMVWAAMMP